MTTATMEELVADAIPIAEASKCIPGRPNKSTIWRWCSIGVRGQRLEAFFSGGRRMTSRSMIADFFRRLNADQPVNEVSSAADLIRRGEEAGKALEALGC